MKMNRHSWRTIRRLGVCLLACLAGCEGVDRRHDPRVVDIQPPREEALGPRTPGPGPEIGSVPDMVERMLETRQDLLALRGQYAEQIRELERAYLVAGDSVKANWCRRQRSLVEQINLETYPYLSAAPPEHRVEVAPEQQIPEADAIYAEALKIFSEVRLIPLAGALEHNKKKARRALEMFKQVLRDYPKSDKVDDCAFFCGEMYKEYLREDDPDDELAIRYYKWAVALSPQTPHPAKFQCAVVYDFRRHDRAKALELYNEVLLTEENGNLSNQRFAATRIEQLTDDEASHLRPRLSAPPVQSASERPVEPPAE